MHPFCTTVLTYSIIISEALAQFQHFVTRPNDSTVAISILHNSSPSALSPGYFFLTPLINNGPTFGPQIFNNNGNLIYNGASTVHNRANGATLCNFANQPSLCFSDGVSAEQNGHSVGVSRFLSTSYVDISPHVFAALGGLRGPDNHEENAMTGSYVLQTVFQPRQLDLSDYGVDGIGWVLDGCFQEVGLPDGELRFQWCALGGLATGDAVGGSAGVGLNETAVHMQQTDRSTNPVGGDGSADAPWDPYHINSVSKDEGTGDYAVSLRHCNVILRICGISSTSAECANKAPGTIAWRLGGQFSDFKNMDFNFSGQHMVRFHPRYQGRIEPVLSIFNDASDGSTDSASQSSGQVFSATYTPPAPGEPPVNGTYTAELLLSLTLPPEYAMLSASQGSLQQLTNGNWLMGFGSHPYYSEFSPTGELLYHASFGGNFTQMQSYRVFKWTWTGTPQMRPDIVTYASNCSAQVWGYASWNGATEVEGWVFRGSNSSSSSSSSTGGGSNSRVLARVPKTTFETATWLSGDVQGARYVRVEAVGKGGRVVGVSEVVETFVPDESTAARWGCTALACERGTNYVALQGGNVVGSC